MPSQVLPIAGHVKGLGRLAAVFSENDRVLSHKGSLGDPGEGHCPGKVTQEKSYLGLLISGLDLY